MGSEAGRGRGGRARVGRGIGGVPRGIGPGRPHRGGREAGGNGRRVPPRLAGRPQRPLAAAGRTAAASREGVRRGTDAGGVAAAERGPPREGARACRNGRPPPDVARPRLGYGAGGGCARGGAAVEEGGGGRRSGRKSRLAPPPTCHAAAPKARSALAGGGGVGSCPQRGGGGGRQNRRPRGELPTCTQAPLPPAAGVRAARPTVACTRSRPRARPRSTVSLHGYQPLVHRKLIRAEEQPATGEASTPRARCGRARGRVGFPDKGAPPSGPPTAGSARGQRPGQPRRSSFRVRCHVGRGLVQLAATDSRRRSRS